MTPEVRRAAVRMAAKAAALVVTINAAACSGGGKKAGPSNTDTGNGTVPAAGACGPYLDGLAVVKPADLPEGDPLKAKTDVYGAFKDPAARTAAQTVSCCQESLGKDGARSKHRWECCSALDDKADGAACTPWGPPCPPEMFLLS